MSGYDVIGDVHGHAVQLRGLLAKLGYTDVDGVWKHPSRTAVFVGDLIDRGDHQLEVVAIVRAMVEAGAARIVLGNHEFNAVAWATPDPDHPGKFLRSHNEKNREQHHEFLEQVGEGSDRHRAIIDWFMTIPLWLDLDGLRVVHACWDPRSIARLDGLVSPSNTLTPELVVASSRSGTVAFTAVETLLKGPEIPVDPHYLDKGGHERCCARFRWWLPDATTLRAGAEIPPDTMTVDGEPYPVLSDEPIDPPTPPYSDALPVVFGHYWPSGPRVIDTPHATCVDYSVAKGGPLVAYRWSGEAELDARNLVAFGAP